jgi:hypothetical protein
MLSRHATMCMAELRVGTTTVTSGFEADALATQGAY